MDSKFAAFVGRLAPERAIFPNDADFGALHLAGERSARNA
jgi:hypothetical protein